MWNHLLNEHTKGELCQYGEERDNLSKEQAGRLRLISLKRDLLEYLGFQNPYRRKKEENP